MAGIRGVKDPIWEHFIDFRLPDNSFDMANSSHKKAWCKYCLGMEVERLKAAAAVPVIDYDDSQLTEYSEIPESPPSEEDIAAEGG